MYFDCVQKHHAFFEYYTGGQVNSAQSPEITQNFTKITKYLTKLKETLTNYVSEKSHVIK